MDTYHASLTKSIHINKNKIMYGVHVSQRRGRTSIDSEPGVLIEHWKGTKLKLITAVADVYKYGGKDAPGNMAVNTRLPTHALCKVLAQSSPSHHHNHQFAPGT